MKATVSERGQVTIPKVMRQRLGIKPKTILDIEVEGVALVVVKANNFKHIDRVYGCLKRKMNTAQVISSLRGKKEK